MHSSSLLDYLVQENLVSPLTLSLPRVNAAMWNHFLLTLANFLDRWISQMLISSKVSHLQFPSTRNQQIAIHAQQWERLPRSMTTCACSSLVPVGRTVRSVQNLFRDKVHNKLLIRFLNYHPPRNFRYLHLSCANVRESSLISSLILLSRVIQERLLMAKQFHSLNLQNLRSRRSTRLRSLSIALLRKQSLNLA